MNISLLELQAIWLVLRFFVHKSYRHILTKMGSILGNTYINQQGGSRLSAFLKEVLKILTRTVRTWYQLQQNTSRAWPTARQTGSAELEGGRMPSEEGAFPTNSHFGSPQVDLFASPENHQFSQFFTRFHHGAEGCKGPRHSYLPFQLSQFCQGSFGKFMVKKWNLFYLPCRPWFSALQEILVEPWKLPVKKPATDSQAPYMGATYSALCLSHWNLLGRLPSNEWEWRQISRA